MSEIMRFIEKCHCKMASIKKFKEMKNQPLSLTVSNPQLSKLISAPFPIQK